MIKVILIFLPAAFLPMESAGSGQAERRRSRMRTAVEAESGIHPVADGLYGDAEQVGNVRAAQS
jgi:hypothetical protein